MTTDTAVDPTAAALANLTNVDRRVFRARVSSSEELRSSFPPMALLPIRTVAPDDRQSIRRMRNFMVDPSRTSPRS